MARTAPFLLYVPGFSRTSANTAVKVAELIAWRASDHMDGTYTVTQRIESAEFGGLSGASVLAPDGSTSLNVVEVSYARELSGGDDAQAPTTGFHDLARNARYALLATLRLVHARKREAKGTRAKLQLAIGLAAVLALYVTVLLIVIAILAAVQPDWLPDWLATDSNVVRLSWSAAGVTFAGVFWWARPRLLAMSRQVQHLMQYVEMDRHRSEVAATLARAIDKITDVDPKDPPTVHVLAYSFGSVVTLDALCPDGAHADRNRLSVIKSLVTVGSPVDFLRLYYVTYFENRMPFPSKIPWTNVFIPADVFGSNFLSDDDLRERAVSGQGPALAIGGRVPDKNIAVGARELKFHSMLAMEGFELHAGYWDERRRTSYLSVVMDHWPPLSSHQDAP